MSVSEASQQANRAEMDPRRLVVISYLVFGAVLTLFFGHMVELVMGRVGITNTQIISGTGIALAEVPSTFAELLTFDHLMEIENDPSTRRSLISERLEGSFATVFRQTVLTRYEQRAYAMRDEGVVVTLAYHSGEDRRVKRALRGEARVVSRRLPEPAGEAPASPWQELTRKVVVPSEQESAVNPRARSARLRAFRRKSR